MYALLLSNASTDTVNRFTLNNNTYGIYMASSLGNIFNNGRVLNNSNIDVLRNAQFGERIGQLHVDNHVRLHEHGLGDLENDVTPNLQYTSLTACGTIS